MQERGLDFLDAEIFFAGPSLEFQDQRRDYGELRIVCFGFLLGRVVIVVYTQRSGDRYIISMRKANQRKQRRFLPLFR